MDTITMQFIDYDFWQYLKHLSTAELVGNLDRPDYQVALIRGIITLDEAFLLGLLS